MEGKRVADPPQERCEFRVAKCHLRKETPSHMPDSRPTEAHGLPAGHRAVRNGTCAVRGTGCTPAPAPDDAGPTGTITPAGGQDSDWERRWSLPGRAPLGADARPLPKAHSLIDKAYSWNNLHTAWKRVRRNKGAAGLDRVTIKAFEKNLDRNLSELQRKLRQDRFQPSPVRRTYIPKDRKGKQACPQPHIPGDVPARQRVGPPRIQRRP